MKFPSFPNLDFSTFWDIFNFFCKFSSLCILRYSCPNWYILRFLSNFPKKKRRKTQEIIPNWYDLLRNKNRINQGEFPVFLVDFFSKILQKSQIVSIREFCCVGKFEQIFPRCIFFCSQTFSKTICTIFQDPETSNVLAIFNLNLKTTEEDIREVFGKFGEIGNCRIVKDQKRNKSRGFCFITFVNEKDAIAAKTNAHGSTIQEKEYVIWKY